jgi:chemotaxis protein methyltransferase CheR
MSYGGGSRPRLSTDEHELLNEFFSVRFGIHYPLQKREILELRLMPRLQALGLSSFIDYFFYLTSGRNGDEEAELEHLISVITNNESYFFRETHQFEACIGHGIGELKQQMPTRTDLKIMCAGCSTGEEPYTLNIFLFENRHKLGGLKPVIDAIDIDKEAIRIALRAEHGRNSLRVLDEGQVTRYFRPIGEGRHELRAPWRRGIRFATGNLLGDGKVGFPQAYDVIFCRNVLIYFTESKLDAAIQNFATWLRPGGLLFLGHSESIIGRSEHFEVVRFGNSIAYRRASGWSQMVFGAAGRIG